MGKQRWSWWAYGFTTSNEISVAGYFDSDEEAKSEGTQRIGGLVETAYLPTTSMPKAKQIIKFKVAQQSGSAEYALRPMRGMPNQEGQG